MTIFNWRELLQSKKFKVLIAGIAGVILMSLAEAGTLTPAAIDQIVNLIMLYLGAQGVADLGKHIKLPGNNK
jgi:hypothetical protein